VKDELDKNFYFISNDLEEFAFTLIRDAEAGGWTDELIEAAYRKTPGNEMLSTFYQKYKQRQAQKQEPQTPETATTKEQTQQDEEATEVLSIPSKFLDEARSYIAKAKQSVLDATAPFNGKGYIPPRKFRASSKLLNTANEYLQDLSLFLDKTIPLLPVTIPYHQDLINKIRTIVTQTDNLSSYIGGSQPLRQNIRESSLKLVQDLKELDTCIQGKRI
jgi:hypothetical protein